MEAARLAVKSNGTRIPDIKSLEYHLFQYDQRVEEITREVRFQDTPVAQGGETLLERLAALAHSQWSGWMEYLFSKCQFNSDGTATIPTWGVERWKRQINTPYEELSEPEKESDRKEARKFIAEFARDKSKDSENFSARPIKELSDSGILWLINRVVFHPRGLALALHAEKETGEVVGWNIVGDGGKVWKFTEVDDDEYFARAKKTIQEITGQVHP